MPLNIKESVYSISSEELEKRNKVENIPVIDKSNKSEKQENTNKAEKSRFYLPVLHINKPDFWEQKPTNEREAFTDEVAKNTCLGNCCNVPGLSAGCCQLDPDDLEHVLGPVDEEWIKRTIRWMKHRHINVTRHDLVIDYEEGLLIGQQFFHDHEVFKRKDTYPILRIQASGIRFACKFLNVQTGKCTIYQQRPDMCKNYYCSYIKSNFLVKTPNSQNTYKKMR